MGWRNMTKMKTFIVLFLLALFSVFFLVGCATTDVAWRKAAVDSYEVLGATVGAVPQTGQTLRASNVITDAQLAQLKDIYNKAKVAYAAAGNALKLASAATDEASKQAALQNYTNLLANFNTLLLQITDLINSFSTKKVSLLEVETRVKGDVLCVLEVEAWVLRPRL